jgi:hypothetical protein
MAVIFFLNLLKNAAWWIFEQEMTVRETGGALCHCWPQSTSVFLIQKQKSLPYGLRHFCVKEEKQVVVDESRTRQLPEIQLLIKIYRKRGIGWQISLDEPIANLAVSQKSF